jgi:FdhE protein
MKDQTSQQKFFDFNSEFANITIAEDMITVNPPAPGILKMGMEKGIPLIDLCPPRVKPSGFYSVMDKVAGIMQKYKPELKDEISEFLASLPSAAEAQELFVAQVFTPGANFTKIIGGNISSETLTFLINYTAKPFLKEYGKITGLHYDPEQWLKGNCPVCGGKPTFALLNKDAGMRYLHCGLCEVKWRYHRLGCPYCGNNESQFFTVEGQEKYRVYFCDKCRGYIKTIDEKRVDGNSLAKGTLDLFREDINTVQLDMLAMQEGYFNQQVDESAKETVK